MSVYQAEKSACAGRLAGFGLASWAVRVGDGGSADWTGPLTQG